MQTDGTTFVAECFWPGVSVEDLGALAERIDGCVTGGVRFRGSLVIREDEIVLCQFEGTADAVRQVAEQARVPFERLLETTVTVPPVKDKRSSDA